MQIYKNSIIRDKAQCTKYTTACRKQLRYKKVKCIYQQRTSAGDWWIIEPTADENYWALQYSWGFLWWDSRNFDVYIAVYRHPKKHRLCNKAKESELGGVEKRKLVSKGSARGLKLTCRSKAKQSLNLTWRTSANVTIPSMEQYLELREGLGQPQVIRETVQYI